MRLDFWDYLTLHSPLTFQWSMLNAQCSMLNAQCSPDVLDGLPHRLSEGVEVVAQHVLDVRLVHLLCPPGGGTRRPASRASSSSSSLSPSSSSSATSCLGRNFRWTISSPWGTAILDKLSRYWFAFTISDANIHIIIRTAKQ